jgi:hypothetical protein
MRGGTQKAAYQMVPRLYDGIRKIFNIECSMSNIERDTWTFEIDYVSATGSRPAAARS